LRIDNKSLKIAFLESACACPVITEQEKVKIYEELIGKGAHSRVGEIMRAYRNESKRRRKPTALANVRPHHPNESSNPSASTYKRCGVSRSSTVGFNNQSIEID
jgi:hypothetical protein